MLNIPQPPKKPDYDKIIKTELNKFESFYNKTTVFKNKGTEKKSVHFQNSAYIEATIENLIATMLTKMDKDYIEYLRELEKYEKQLIEYDDILSTQLEKNNAELKKKEEDYCTIKTFYDNFHLLAKAKFDLISDFISKRIGLNEDDN